MSVHQHGLLSLLGPPTGAVGRAGHFSITNEETQAPRQLLSRTTRRKPGPPSSMPNAVLLVSFPSLALFIK